MSSDTLLREEDNLTYWAAKQAVIAIGTPLAVVYACQLMFSKKDGSLFVQFPYFRHQDGIATLVHTRNDGGAARTIRFPDEGKVTSHLVKYSHHPDGRVHFSQDGKVRTEICRNSEFPLNGPIGKLFQLHAFRPLGGFLPLDDSNMKKGRPHLVFNYPKEVPQALKISAEWRKKADVAGWSRPVGTPLGPKARIESVVTGGSAPAYFFGQPEGFPLQDHLVVVTCEHMGVEELGIPRPPYLLNWKLSPSLASC